MTTDPPTDPTHVLADFVAGLTLDAVADTARERAIDLLLDALVCALAADHAEDTAAFAAMTDAVGGAGDTTVIGGAPRSMAGAVMLNGFRITAVTACDVYAPAELHSEPAIVPAALALAERDGVDGRALLTAVAAGFEVAVRLADSFDRTQYRARGWHSPGVVSPFGAAAAAASVLGLDATRMRHALAIAGSQAAGTWAQRGSPTVKFHQARAGLAGVTSALLANEGFDGAREVMTATEGGMYTAYAPAAAESSLDNLGQRWALEEIGLRLWPGSARVQPAMAAASQIVRQGAVRWAEIDRVEVRVAPRVAVTQAWAAQPTSTFAALASLPFTVATTLRHGTAAPSRFTEAGYEDPELRAFLASRVDVVADEAVPPLGAHVAVQTADGARHESAVDIPRGDPRSPASRDELAAKAHDFGDDRIGPAAVDELVERVRRLADEPELEPILALVRLAGQAERPGTGR